MNPPGSPIEKNIRRVRLALENHVRDFKAFQSGGPTPDSTLPAVL